VNNWLSKHKNEVKSMGEKGPRKRTQDSEFLDKRLIEGFYDSATRRLSYLYLPTIYKNHWLRSMHHPKLKKAYLELTNKCNLQCEMCTYQASDRKIGEMARPQFESYVNQLSEIGVDVLYLHFGGESLLHPNFTDFLKYAICQRDKGKIGRVGWVDNGMLFNQDIADLSVSLKVDCIIFSIDGVGQVNDNIRIGSKYPVIERNIKYLLKKRGTAKKPEVSLNICDYGKTEEQKLEIYREWVHLVDEITLIPSILPDNSWESKNILSKKLKTAPPPAFCYFPLDTIVVSWDGKVTGCCQDYVFKMDLGDGTKETIKQIWNGQKFRNLRKAVITNTFSKGSPCYKCEFWQVNFKRREEAILDGQAIVSYGPIVRKIRKA
jgi:radical SAM protein with 4Fe4S-binding SPASM domain